MNGMPQKVLMDLQRINGENRDGCRACGNKFNLGDTAVLACGLWAGGPQYIHEHEAVFDRESHTFFERSCWNSQRGR